jgi:hypothetical protein
MASKLNRGISEMYKNPPKSGMGESYIKPVEPIPSQNITVEKNKTPFVAKFKKNTIDFIKKHDIDFKYLLLAIPIIAIFIIAGVIQHKQSLESHAGTHTATVSFQLDNWKLPPQSTFGVWVNPDSPVAFADVEISFDPKIVNIVQEISVVGPLTRKIKVTSMTDANLTGKISIVLMLDPANKTNPPSNVFQIANLSFGAKTTSQNVTSAINFATSSMQLVAIDESVFSLTTKELNLSVNPTTTPTISPSPTPTPIIVATPVPAKEKKGAGGAINNQRRGD